MQITPGSKQGFLFCLAFFCANVILSSFYLDIWPTPNPVSRALPALTFSQDRTLQIDKYANETIDKSKVGDHFYSDKAPLPTLLMIPVYECMRWVRLDRASDRTGKRFPVYIWRPNGLEDGRELAFTAIIPLLFAGSFLFGSIPFAAILWMSYAALRARTSRVSPVPLVMFSFYGSFVFVYAGTFFNHVFAGFLLLASYITLKNARYFLSGLLLGLSFLSEYTVLIAAPVCVVLILVHCRSFRKAFRFVLGLVPSGIAIMLYNWQIAGNPFKMLNAYHAHGAYRELSRFYGLSFPSLDALWGLSFSGAMGIFVFTPILFIVGYYFIKRACTDEAARETLKTDYLAWFSILFFLAIASFFTWWGGWGYGLRYLTALAVLLIYEGLALISGFNLSCVLFFAVTGYGLFSAWLAKATLVYMVPDRFLRNEEFSSTLANILLPEARAGRFNSNNVLSLMLNVGPGTSAVVWLLLFLMVTFGFASWHRHAFAAAPAPKQNKTQRQSGIKNAGRRPR